MLAALDGINAKLSIGARMRVLAVLMVVPVAVTSWFLFEAHISTIDFAKKELVGVQGLNTVWTAIDAGARGAALDASLDSVVAKTPALSGVIGPDDLASLQGKQGGALIDAANTAFQNISDKSNLTLDPDLDSFYIMDVQSTKLPALVAEGRKLLDAKSTTPDTSAFIAALAALDDSASRTRQARKGAVLPAVEASSLDGLNSAGKAFAKAATDSNWRAVSDASSKLFGECNADLGNLLQARIQRSWSAIVTQVGSSLLILALALALTLSIASGLTQRLRVLSAKMRAIMDGQDAGVIPFQKDRHETGVIVQTLAAFKETLAETERMRLVQHQTEEDAINAQRRAMLNLSEDFEHSVLSIVDRLGGATDRLKDMSEGLCSDAETTSDRSNQVASNMEATALNVQSVAGATEEMAASSQAIASQAETASAAADHAATQADNAVAVVSQMQRAASRIGSAVELISSITSQTNLLALNATIEAARAGEAGKGFSVVAAEVKALAQQTAQATREIAEQVQGVQSATENATGAISSISEAVLRMKEISTEISFSVGQQSSAVSEISRSTQEVAATSATVSSAIGDVSVTAAQTGRHARASLAEVLDLAAQAHQLKAVANGFLKGIRLG